MLLTCALFFVIMQSDDKAPHHPPVRYHYEVRKDLSFYFSNSDEIIEAIRNALVNKDKSISLSYSSDKESMQDFAPIVRELFTFALSETDRPCEGDYLSCCVGGYELRYKREGEGSYDYSITITPSYYTDKKQEQAVSDEVSRLLESFAFDEKTADYEKVSRIYDYICSNVSYDTVHKNNEHNHLKATAFSALIYKSASCQGYAAAMYRLLREADINCRVITGMAQGESGEYEYHAWNIICIDGLWYNCDVTWDIQSGTHELFLKSDKDFKNHERDKGFTTDEFLTQYKMAEESYPLP